MAQTDGSKQSNQFRVGLRVKTRVLGAMIVREMLLRFGRDGAGFIWVIIEPMLLTVGVLFMWSLMEPEGKHGFPIVAFVFTGYMPLTLWRHLTNSMAQIFRRSVSLRYHRRISNMDVVLARQIQEFIGTTAAMLFVFAVLVAADLMAPPKDLTMAGIGWLAMAGLGFGGGMLIAALTEYEEATDRFIGPFQYLLVPISGSFFLVDWLPYDFQRILLLNPLTHCFEMFRAGYFGEGTAFHYSIGYVSAWIVVLLYFGLVVMDRIKDRMQIT
jgi:capsular polysaccharide transport system permease protein